MPTSRTCDKCGARSSPYIPRERVGDELWCTMCAQNQGRRVMAAQDELHPMVAWQKRTFGCHHIACGRVLSGRRTAATFQEQEARMNDAELWKPHKAIEPARFAIEGARAYSAKKGFADPHEHGFHHVMQDPDTVRRVGRTYDALPEHDPKAVPHFEAMRKEIGDQYHHLTHTMGVQVHVVGHDPYKDASEMVHDVSTNKRLQVLGTHVTGGHPFFSHEENDKFRAVHDFFGHAATGRAFDGHGEQAAYLAHSKMFSHHARPAMASETKGQNTSVILHGDFGPQKIALLPKHDWDDGSLSGHDPKSAAAHEAGFFRNSFPKEYLQENRDKGKLTWQKIDKKNYQASTPDGLAAASIRDHGDGWEWTAHSQHPHCRAIRSGVNSDNGKVPGPGYAAISAESVAKDIAEHLTTEEHHPDKPCSRAEGWSTLRMSRLAFSTSDRRIVRVAHDSGDGETIFHCPFCGSGQVIATSNGTISCEFCTTDFTVQVQPTMPAFPQTIDGQPIDVPGMPNGGKDANVPPGAVPGAGPESELGPDGQPLDDTASGDELDAGDDSPDGDDGDDKPAFLKGGLLYRTVAGRGLTEEQMMRHLAITCRIDDAVLGQIRATALGVKVSSDESFSAQQVFRGNTDRYFGGPQEELARYKHQPARAQFRLESVPLHHLKTHTGDGIEPRLKYHDYLGDGDDEGRLSRIEDNLDKKKPLQPGIAVKHQGDYLLLDGGHRAAVYENRGHTHMPVYVTDSDHGKNIFENPR